MSKFILTATTLATLAACSSGGGSSDDDDTLRGPFTDIVPASYAAGLPPGPSNRTGPLPDTVTLQNDGTTYTLARDETLDQNSFASYQTDAINSIAMLARTEYTDVAVTYLQPTTAFSATGVVYGGMTDDNKLASGGSAVYRGDYAGVIVSNPSGFIIQRVDGRVLMNANFDNDTLSGTISNRRFASLFGASEFGPETTDVVLQEGTIDAIGNIVGTTTGGNLDNASWAQATGTYNATVSGPQSNDIAGYIILDQTIDGTAYNEFGGFLTSR